MMLTYSINCTLLGLMLVVSSAYAEDAARKVNGSPVQESTQAKKQAEFDAREKPLREADALIKNGKSDEAYALLAPLEFERSGEVRFDYLIGIAALESGKADKATLAFERVLTVDPNFFGARLDMARAYYQLGDMPRAKTEFLTLMKQNPPETARTTIQQYLDAIAARETAEQTKISGYVEGAFGYDDNVNVSTWESQVRIFNTPLKLSPNNIKSGDNYFSVAAGGEVNHSITPAFAVYAGLDLRDRSNQSRATFNAFTADVHAGVALGDDADLFRVGAQGGQYLLANMPNRDTTGLTADWRHAFSSKNQLTVFTQNTQYRFVDRAMQPNDFDQYLLGVGGLHILDDGKSAFFGSLYYGTETDVAIGGRIDGSKDFIGMRIGGQSPVTEQTEFFASAGGVNHNYIKNNVLFALNRADSQYDLNMGVNWHLDKLWTLRPQLSFARNDSNIVLYSYDRTDMSVSIRRDFK